MILSKYRNPEAFNAMVSEMALHLKSYEIGRLFIERFQNETRYFFSNTNFKHKIIFEHWIKACLSHCGLEDALNALRYTINKQFVRNQTETTFSLSHQSHVKLLVAMVGEISKCGDKQEREKQYKILLDSGLFSELKARETIAKSEANMCGSITEIENEIMKRGDELDTSETKGVTTDLASWTKVAILFYKKSWNKEALLKLYQMFESKGFFGDTEIAELFLFTFRSTGDTQMAWRCWHSLKEANVKLTGPIIQTFSELAQVTTEHDKVEAELKLLGRSLSLFAPSDEPKKAKKKPH
eukprot:TRINITY_DN3662_c0_g2_i1.p1 TRINITY_DN3662_c0_g2~~TRINITY_DN3662_c0_g2_i1.p1  ORF type:complete len:297 (-),score=29.90 TRINITY_DN3662_c0_g2_i1:43-933(-)